MSQQRGAVQRLVLALAVVLGPLLLLGPSALSGPGLPQALAGGALAAAVLAGSALAAGLAVATALAVLLLTATPRAPAAVRWQADVVVRLDDRPGRPGRTRPRAPGAGTSRAASPPDDPARGTTRPFVLVWSVRMPSSWSSLNPLAWLETAVSGVLVAAHALLGALGLDPASGAAWVGAVVVLVVVVRLALLPLVLRQVRASHRLARVAPQLRALQGRYSRPTGPGGRQQLTRDPAELARWRAEQRALHAEAGASPLSFLPVLLQVPVMIALARVLDGAARGHAVGLLTPVLAAQAGAATVVGAPLSGSLLGGFGGGAGAVLAVALVVVVAVATWVTTHLQLTRGTAPEALEGPVGQAQRTTVWLVPLLVAATSAAVPLGLLVYWASSAVWSLGQGLALLRWLPTPGTPAAAARDRRLAERRQAPRAADRP